MATKVNMICIAALCLLLTAINISVEAQVPAYVPTDGLVGWWDFNGQLDDQNGSAMTFSLTGSTQLGLDKDENPQSALQLLGDGSAYTDNNGSIPQYSAMTLSYWIKLDGGTPVALALGASSGQSWASFFYATSVNGLAGVSYGAGCAGTGGEESVPGAESYGGEWHHVVMAIDGTNQPYSVYVDGELLGIGNANTTSGCNASQLHLGVDIWSLPEYMIGFLDDLGVWDRVLTPEEVSELYQAATAGCVDPSACNYNADATEDDGSCVFPPVIDLGEDIETCEESVILDAGPGFDSYLWSTGETTQIIEVSESGDYNVEVGNNVSLDSYSLNFDGNNDFVEIGNNNPLINNSSEATFSARINTYDNATWRAIATRWNNFGSENWWFGLADNGRIHFADGGSSVSYSNPNSYDNDGNWYYITVTKSEYAINFYSNGVHVGSATSNVDVLTDSSESLLIAAKNNATITGVISPDFFHGLISTVEIWDRALSQEEIIEYQHCSPIGDEEGLVGYWNFSEGSGTTAIDLSGNGNDGVINGAVFSEDVPETNCPNCTSSDTISVTFLSSGCTDPQACNYNSDASCDDGSCEYASCAGCTDEVACNYDPTATIDDGLCEYITNPVADLTEGSWALAVQLLCAGDPLVSPIVFGSDQTVDGVEDSVWSLCDGQLTWMSGTTTTSLAWDGDAFTGVVSAGDVFDNCVTVYQQFFGCKDSSACNYDASANTNDNSCIYPEGICDTCSGETDGTGVVVDNDADDDGVCDDDEIVGCQDPDACNYDPLATDEGECYYMPVYSIEGSLFTSAFDLELYSYTNSEGSTYAWTCTGCAIQSGNGTSTIELVWGEEGINELCVQETDSTGCVGELLCVDVAVTATNIEDIDGDHFTIYPNPASTSITISTNAALLSSPYRITDAQGKLVMEGALRNTITVLNTDQLSNGQYTLAIISDEAVITKPLIIQK